MQLLDKKNSKNAYTFVSDIKCTAYDLFACCFQNVEPQALEAIIEYVYTPDSLVITEDNVQVALLPFVKYCNVVTICAAVT